MASTPPPPGMRRSMRITSGSSAAARSSASTPSAASPSTRKPAADANMPRRPSRTTGWSSTTSRETVGCPGASVMADQRYASRHRRPQSRLGLDAEGPGDAFGAGPHAVEAESARAGAGGADARVEAASVVADVEGDRVAHVGEGDADPGGARVPCGVGQRLLRDAQQGGGHLVVERFDGPGG